MTDDLFFKYETDDVNNTCWFKTQASVMSNYDIVHIRLVSSFEILMHMRVLRCPEVGKLYITYIKGIYVDEDNYEEPFRFGLDDIKGGGGEIPMTYAGTSFMAEVRRALHALFPGDLCVSLFDQDEFEEMRRRVLLRNLCIIRHMAAPVALHQSVMGCIWEHCRPDWYDFDYEKQLPITMKVWIGVYVYEGDYFEV